MRRHVSALAPHTPLHDSQLAARKHLFELLFEVLDPALLPRQLPPSLLGTREWVRLRPGVSFDSRVGLAEWLYSVHGTDLLNRCVCA